MSEKLTFENWLKELQAVIVADDQRDVRCVGRYASLLARNRVMDDGPLSRTPAPLGSAPNCCTPTPGVRQMSEDTNAFASEYVAPFDERFWRWLGFHCAHQERPEETAEFPSYIVTDVHIGVSLLDRLRLLISGKLEVEVVTQTSVEVPHARSKSAVAVSRP